MPGIRVQGASLLDNGVPWVPRGVQIVGLVAPPPALVGKYIAAGQHFGLAELQAAVAEHADIIRFQVSEFGIDPQGPLYSAAYVQSVQARSRGGSRAWTERDRLAAGGVARRRAHPLSVAGRRR